MLPLLICRGVWDRRKPYYRSHVSDPTLLPNENGHYETLKALKLNCFVYHEQSVGSKKVITYIYHIIKYSWSGVHCMWPVVWFLHVFQGVTCQSGGARERCDFNQIALTSFNIYTLKYLWITYVNPHVYFYFKIFTLFNM